VKQKRSHAALGSCLSIQAIRIIAQKKTMKKRGGFKLFTKNL